MQETLLDDGNGKKKDDGNVMFQSLPRKTEKML